MKGKDIKVGTIYRASDTMRGTYFYKCEALAIRTVRKWNRKEMNYVDVPGEVEIKVIPTGVKRNVRFQEIIEPWEEFEKRDPRKAADFHYQQAKNEHTNKLREVLVSYADKVSDKMNGRPSASWSYGWGREAEGMRMNVPMTEAQYLAFVGVTPEQYKKDVGPAPVAPATNL